MKCWILYFNHKTKWHTSGNPNLEKWHIGWFADESGYRTTTVMDGSIYDSESFDNLEDAIEKLRLIIKMENETNE